MRNAVRHSGATRLAVKVDEHDELSIDITDKGQGIPMDNQRRSRLANMAKRAARVGGQFRITSPVGGTDLPWTAPLTGF